MKNKRRIKGLMVLLGMLMMMFSSGCGKKTIDLNSYISFEVSGYNGYGEVTVVVDEERLKEDCKDVQVKPAYKEAQGDYTGYDLIMECTDLESSGHSIHLKNGDKVTYVWNCEDEFFEKYTNVRLKYSDIVYEIKDLGEVEVFNPYEYITVSFSGLSSYGSIKISVDDRCPEMRWIYVYADKEEGLKNGDVVTIRSVVMGDDDFFATRFGKKLLNEAVTYVVEGLRE